MELGNCLGFSALSAALARAEARVGPLAHNLRWYPEVASTNDLALACAETGDDEGVVVVAGTQTRGRGRMGRAWSSPPGAGIYASVLLRPEAHLPLLTLAAGVAVAEGIEAATGLRPSLKWPNDIYAPSPAAPGRKLGGILTEGGFSRNRAFAVIGIGINVGRAAYPPDVAGRASSLEEELGRDVDAALVLVESLAALWRRYEDLRHGRQAAVLEAWTEYARPTFGRRVQWTVDGETRSGRVEGVDDGGALRVRTSQGVAHVIAGEVLWT